MELLLENREILELGEKLRGVTIHCQAGRCWLTQSGDSRDHILRAGGRFRVESRGKVLLTAEEACRIRLLGPTGSTPQVALWRQLGTSRP